MEPITFILNPAAGKGKADRVWARARRLLEGSGQPFELLRTSGRGEASRMAAAAATTRVVAVGGDGTIQEVANGLIGTQKIMGIIPAGSGNDLIKSLGIPLGVNPAVDIISSGEHRRIDVGQVVCSSGPDAGDDPDYARGRFFVNGVGVGFDAAVAARTREIPWLTGTALYLAAVFQTLGKYKAPLFRVQADGEEFESRNLLFAIGNGRCAGGGFYLTPEASVEDGLLDVCSIREASVGRILVLMPKALQGKHGQVREVKFFRTRSLRLISDDSFYVHADGEIVGDGVRRVDVRIVAHGLEGSGASGLTPARLI